VKAWLAGALLLAAFQAWAADMPDGLYAGEADVLLFQQGRVVRGPSGALGGPPVSRSGRASIEGGALVVTWGDGRREAGRYGAAGAACFLWESARFCKVRGFERGARLQGRYSGGYSEGGTERTISVSFEQNGRFALASVETGASIASSRSDSGMYELDGTTLTLQRSRRFVVFLFPDGRLYFDGAVLRPS
jgi:hypothetical protein